ncbi:MAG: BREX system ATP-binding domain-containing protein, partial [Anaerolineaceae bacterium]
MTEPASDGPLGRTPFVGREDERATLSRLLEQVQSGQGAFVMLGGEPGVGKTRLAEEVAEEARSRGFFTVVGHCYEMEGSRPYLPFVEVIEQVMRTMPEDRLRAALGDAALEVARLVTALRRFVPDLQNVRPPLPEEGRWPLFNGLRDFLGRASGNRLVLLTLEDLHWADESSLLLLQHIAQHLGQMPVLVIGTYREAELGVTLPLAKTLQELFRQRLAHDLVLHRLSEEGVAAMLQGHGLGPPPPQLVSLVYRETEGNPFFVEEVVRHLAEQGKLLETGGGWSSGAAIGELEVPRSVRLVIEQRLARVSDDCRHLLAIAAVVGRNFSFEILEALGELAPDAVLDAIEEAVRASLIQDASWGHDARYKFAHELVRQTLLSGLSLPRRQRLHLRIADAMERVFGGGLDAHLADLAFHYSQAGAGANPERVVHYSTLAGRQAMAQAAYSDGAAHFRSVLSARAGQAVDDDMADVLFDLGRACDATLGQRQAWECFVQAFAHYAHSGNVARAVEVAGFAGSRWLYFSPAQTDMVERALELVEQSSAAYGILNASLGLSLGYQNAALDFAADIQSDNTRVAEAFRRAHEVAANLGLPHLEMEILRLEMETDLYLWRPESALAKAELLVNLARELTSPLHEAGGLAIGGVVKSSLGDLAGGREDTTACRALAERLHLWGLVIHATEWQVNQAMNAGDWEAMRSAIAAGLTIDPGEMNLIFHKAILHLSLGTLENAREGIHRLVENMEATASQDNLGSAATQARVYVAMALSAASHDAGLPTEPGLAKR